MNNFIQSCFSLNPSDPLIELKILETLESIEEEERRKKKRAKNHRTHTLRGQIRAHKWQAILTQATVDNSFISLFRIPKSLFDFIHEKLKHRLSPNLRASMASTGGLQAPVSAHLIIGSSLRFLGGGDIASVEHIFSISRYTFYNYFEKFLDSILLEFPDVIKFPVSKEERQKISIGFQQLVHAPIVSCVGSIDGCHLPVRKPRKKECSFPSDYYNRKHFYSINMIACCDSDRKFMVLSLRCPGKCSDSVSLQVSNFWTELQDGELQLDPEEFFVADEGFQGCSHLIVPFGGVSGRKTRNMIDMDNANFFISRMRICIEQVFGEYKARWALFRRDHRLSLRKMLKAATVAGILHNLCIDWKLKVSDIDEEAKTYYEECVSNIKEVLDDTANGNCPQRAALLRVVQENQLTRP
jgi:hypothetical protein